MRLIGCSRRMGGAVATVRRLSWSWCRSDIFDGDTRLLGVF